MQKYVKIYLDYFDIGETDTWYCEGCMREFPINNGLNIHHIHGRGKGKDVIKNLMSLCIQKCHIRAHASKNYVSKEQFQLIHNYFRQGTRKAFLK
jgi:hypothetical protein